MNNKKREPYKSKDKYLDKSSALIDYNSKDIDYIINNEDLKKKHLEFIDDLEYTNKWALKFLGVEPFKKSYPLTQEYLGCTFKIFYKFPEYYKSVAKWWKHLIQSCYDKKYRTYKYIGAKGIRMCEEFLDSKFFCKWCIENKLTGKPGTYKCYLQRKDKTKDYTPDNCYVITEKDLRSGKDISSVLQTIYVVKQYDNQHHPSVMYITTYTRFFVWDFNIEDACNIPYIIKHKNSTDESDSFGISPRIFYESVAADGDVSYTTFVSRLNWAWNNKLTQIRPYDLLRPDYSVSEDARRCGVVTYYKKYKEKSKQSKNNKCSTIDDMFDSVYNYSTDYNVYSDCK